MSKVIAVTVTTRSRSESFVEPDLRLLSSGKTLVLISPRGMLGAYFWPLAVTFHVFEGDETAPF